MLPYAILYFNISTHAVFCGSRLISTVTFILHVYHITFTCIYCKRVFQHCGYCAYFYSRLYHHCKSVNRLVASLLVANETNILRWVQLLKMELLFLELLLYYYIWRWQQ